MRVIGGQEYFDAFWRLVPGEIYFGGFIGEWRAAMGHFDVRYIVDTTPERCCPDEVPSCEIFLCPFHDDNTLPDMRRIDEVVEVVLRALIDKPGPVAVMCLMGGNRSSFLAGLLLRKIEGYSGERIFEMIKDANPDACTKGVLRDYIRSLP